MPLSTLFPPIYLPTLLLSVAVAGHAVSAADSTGRSEGRLSHAPMMTRTPASATRALPAIEPLRLKPKIAARLRPMGQGLKKPSGPDPQASLALRDLLDDEALVAGISEVCGWDADLILQDKTAAHVFYYLPREFLVLHHAASGYGLGVQYNRQAEPGQPSVNLTAELAAPHRTGDVTLLKAILGEALDVKPGDPFEVRSVAGLGAMVNLEALQAGLAIDPERIHATPPTHLRKPLRITLLLTQDEAEAALAQMAHEGLAGTVAVAVGDQTVNIGMRIRYADFAGTRVEGLQAWLEGGQSRRITNATAFPLDIRDVGAYRIKAGQLERVTKRLKASRPLKPGQSRAFTLQPPQRIFGGDIVMAWLGTELDADCDPCLRKLRTDVARGIAVAPASVIVLEAIPTVFEDFELYKLVVGIQSPYFTAGGGEVREVEIELTADMNREEVSLYFPENKGPSPLLFKYQLKAVKESGETVKEALWHDSRDQSQIFGSIHLEGLLDGEVPP